MLQGLTYFLSNAIFMLSLGHSFWFYFEIVLIICVIIYQLYHTRNVYFSIEELKGIFNKSIEIKEGFINKTSLSEKEKTIDKIIFTDEPPDTNYLRISIADTQGKGIIKQICDDINNYLINNYGADVNFANIKDIIDRHIEVKDNEISHSITMPLYLGLSATMIGIILGLLAMPNLSAGDFSEGISALIRGVGFAMFASLVGLFSTSYLSVIKYGEANKTLLKSKNEQISHLQAKLLPAIVDANQTGLQGLKTQIDQFSRDAIKISSDLKETVNKIEEITINQVNIINKIETINVTKVSRTNLELLEKLENNIQSFNQFANYIELMGKISVQLHDFASRTANIDSIVEHIESSLSENSRLMEFLTSHFDKIEKAGNAALRAVDLADSHFAEAIEKVNKEIQKRIEATNQIAVNHESKLFQTYNEIGDKLNLIANEHVAQLKSAFKEAVPKFGELKHLTELPLIREQFTNNQSGKKFIEVVEALNESVKKVQESINQVLISKLSSIEDTLNKTKPDSPKQTGELKKSSKPGMEEKPVSILEAITKLFKK